MHTFQLQNTSPVPAEWGIGKVSGSAKDEAWFVLTPNFGVIPPGEAVNVEVAFTPTESRAFLLRLPLKVAILVAGG